ncbi:prepilin-type N-terminal cleavage/methylation domain-containing protein [Candidatus Halobeggiatoa sp. HSG11]|nr:prepilin-type N-terminal cleavage/methylation domain-containing protein [Candidatus Halobeggiatoa sp. HSG11]
MNKQQGFTLVEIAIVMVIIGLLLGGVLKGQEIVKNAKIKNLENDFSGITAAIYSYQDRYRALPGDDLDTKTKARFGATIAGGDNDGNIEGVALAPKTNDESGMFWTHLRSAGLIDGEFDDDSLPGNAFSGLTGVSSENVLNITGGRTYIGFSKIPNDIASILESRSDNENPTTGSIRASKDANNTADDATYTGDDDLIRNVFFIL